MQIATSANRHKSHKAPPQALANWPEGTGRWAVPRKPADRLQGRAVGRPRGAPLALPLPLPTLMGPELGPEQRPWPLQEGRQGRGQEVEGAEWVGRGFWSRLIRPVPPLLSHPEPGSCHSRLRTQTHTWSGHKTKQGRAAGQKGSVGSVSHPDLSTAHQPGMRSLSHLVSK